MAASRIVSQITISQLLIFMYRAEDEVGRALSNVASLLDPRQRDVFFKIVAFVGKIASGIYRSCHRVHLANKRNGIDPSLDRDGTRLSSPAKATLGDGRFLTATPPRGYLGSRGFPLRILLVAWLKFHSFRQI